MLKIRNSPIISTVRIPRASLHGTHLSVRNPARALHAAAPRTNPWTRPRSRHSGPAARRRMSTMDKDQDLKAISTEKACPGNCFPFPSSQKRRRPEKFLIKADTVWGVPVFGPYVRSPTLSFLPFASSLPPPHPSHPQKPPSLTPSPQPQSQAIHTPHAIYVSGQLPALPDGSLPDTTIAEKTRLCIENITTILEAAGSGLERIVKVLSLPAEERRREASGF